ncbi:unnamed protein product, partial [Protopolystoma xenopodis]
MSLRRQDSSRETLLKELEYLNPNCTVYLDDVLAEAVEPVMLYASRGSSPVRQVKSSHLRYNSSVSRELKGLINRQDYWNEQQSKELKAKEGLSTPAGSQNVQTNRTIGQKAGSNVAGSGTGGAVKGERRSDDVEAEWAEVCLANITGELLEVKRKETAKENVEVGLMF